MTASILEHPWCSAPAQEASRDGDGIVWQEDVVSNTNMDSSATTGATLMQCLPAQEPSCDGVVW